MSERIAWLYGQYVVESEAKVSILDRGFLYGDSVYDSSRTFDGVPWRMRAHIDRLYMSCRYARLDPGISADEMEAVSMASTWRKARRAPSPSGSHRPGSMMWAATGGKTRWRV